jgi:hypothetical protein
MATMTLTSRNFGSQMSRLYKVIEQGETLTLTVEPQATSRTTRSSKYAQAMAEYSQGKAISMDMNTVDTAEKFITFTREYAQKI